MTTWGVIATIKAPARDILRFAAYHLEAGAALVHVFLDDRNPQAFHALKAHPKCRVTVCDERHWDRILGRRPEKHQARQSQNASFGYRKAQDVDWVIHMDVDEFLVSDAPVADALAALPQACKTARTRPIEALADPGGADTEPQAFKAFLPNGPERLDTALKLYPTFGAYVKGGFVSHVAGKVFVRTGLADTSLRIHNVFQGNEMNPGMVEMPDVALAHCHSKSWADWRAQHAYRHDKGSYRAELAAAMPTEMGGLTLHDLFTFLIDDQGEAGLRAFFDEVCADTPEHRARLQALGLLRLHNLALEAKLSAHFPDYAL